MILITENASFLSQIFSNKLSTLVYENLIRILRIEREDNKDSKGQRKIVNNTEGNIIGYWIGNPEAS